jgi:DNA-binding PadR family transcriptional regulator
MNTRILCLGILSFGDASGYEIKKSVEDGMFNHFIEASYGSIYPALTRLTEEGLLDCHEEAQTGRPDKKVYTLTDAGRRELAKAISAPPRDAVFKSEFLFVMLLGNLVPREHLARIYLERLAHVRAEYEMIRECAQGCEDPGTRFATGYGLAMFEAKIRYLEEAAGYVGLDPAEVRGAAGRKAAE